MVKKLLWIILVVAILAGAGYGCFMLSSVHHPAGNALQAIPKNAALILQVDDAPATWKEKAEPHDIWQAISSIEIIQKFTEETQLLDSLLKNSDVLRALLKKQPLYLSFHNTSATEYHVLFAIGLPGDVSQEKAMQAIGQLTKGKPLSSHIFENKVVEEISLGDKKFNYSVTGNCILGSFSNVLLENAIRQVNEKVDPLNLISYLPLEESSKDKQRTTLFLNHQELPKLLSSTIFEDNGEWAKQFSQYATSSEVEISFRDKAIHFSGLSSTDSGSFFLNLFKNQTPQERGIARIAPVKTDFLMQLGISDFSQYIRDWKNLNPNKDQHSTATERWNSECNCTVEDELFSWVNKEIGIMSTNTSLQFPRGYSYLVLGALDVKNARLQLDNLGRQLNSSFDADSLTYNGFPIARLSDDPIFPTLLGPSFEGITDSYYTTLSSYIVFANSIPELKSLILDYQNEFTLSKSQGYRKFIESFSEVSNLYIYARTPLALTSVSPYIKSELLSELNNHLPELNSMGKFGLQVSYDSDNLYYNFAKLEFTGSSKSESELLWKYKLDTAVAWGPGLMTNHNTHHYDALIQDAANQLYLLDDKGELFWKRQLEEAINGKVHQIDAFDNGKLQFLFNTDHKIYLIDRNGKDVDGFPIKLSKGIKTNISVLDYDNNRNFRILVESRNKLLNFNTEGKSVKGWKPNKLKKELLYPIKHLRIGAKDYLMGIDQGGSVIFLDRKGSKVEQFQLKTMPSPLNEPAIDPGENFKSYALIYTDTTGQVIKFTFDGKESTLVSSKANIDHQYHYDDIDLDQRKDHLLIDGNKLMTFTNQGEPIFVLELEDSISTPISVYRFSETEVAIGVASRNQNKAYLITPSGGFMLTSPIVGETAFGIRDINRDQKLELVIGNVKSEICAYRLND